MSERMSERTLVCTPWHVLAVRDAFLDAWKIKLDDPRLLLREDIGRIGCGAMKNLIIDEAIERGAETVVVLDSDCHPEFSEEYSSLDEFIALHEEALEPVEIEDFLCSPTVPPARGIPYFNRSLTLPVAASIGFWVGMPDRDAARQLAEGVETPMEYDRRFCYMQPTMMCGMNLAFKPREWLPWCRFLPVSRMDDVFMSWLWSREIARRKHCINFGGPLVRHVRQSHVFNSLVDEVKWLEFNETIWKKIWEHPSDDYATLRALIPV